MSIKNKLKVEVRGESISLYPNRGLISSLIWFVTVIITTAIIGGVFSEQLGEGGRVLCIGIIIYFVIHGLADYILRLNVRYEFDYYANAVYKDNLLFGRKQIMKLEEAVIFINADAGNWYYALGIRKKQFLKNYKISPGFGSGKASQKRASDYEEEILSSIEALIAKLSSAIR